MLAEGMTFDDGIIPWTIVDNENFNLSILIVEKLRRDPL